jgi:hypothetical protein
MGLPISLYNNRIGSVQTLLIIPLAKFNILSRSKEMDDRKVHQTSDGWIISGKILTPVTLCVGIFVLLTFYGCNSYEKTYVKPWRSEYKPYSTPTTGVYSPSFIFDSQQKASTSPNYVDSEQYGRMPWPTSDQAVGFVSDPEIITYREYRYDYRYIDSDNRPRNHFRNYLRGHRTGQQYR